MVTDAEFDEALDRLKQLYLDGWITVEEIDQYADRIIHDPDTPFYMNFAACRRAE